MLTRFLIIVSSSEGSGRIRGQYLVWFSHDPCRVKQKSDPEQIRKSFLAFCAARFKLSLSGPGIINWPCLPYHPDRRRNCATHAVSVRPPVLEERPVPGCHCPPHSSTECAVPGIGDEVSTVNSVPAGPPSSLPALEERVHTRQGTLPTNTSSCRGRQVA